MRSRIFLLLLMFAFNVGLINCGGQSLVSPQSHCKIRCENGGMCVFDLDRPDFHSCICLLGVYTGDRCQIKVATPEDADTTTVDPSISVEPTHPKNIQQSEADHEEARRRDEERKREYERQVAERTRKEKEDREKAADEERRRQQHEQYWREETARREQQRAEAERRIQEQRVRDDERRRQHESERSQLEERRREEETRRLAAQREIEEARARDEERRRQESETQKVMEEKRTELVNEQFEYDGEEDYPQVAEKEDEYDEGYETEKSEDTTMMTTTTTNKMKPMVEGEKEMKEGDDGSDMVMEKDEIDDDNEEEPLRKEDEQLIDSIKHVFNKAVDETVKEHPIDDDEYWDDGSKKMEEDKWKEGDATQKTEEADEYGMEEGTEGWMMVKKEKENAASGVTVFLTTVISLVALFF